MSIQELLDQAEILLGVALDAFSQLPQEAEVGEARQEVGGAEGGRETWKEDIAELQREVEALSLLHDSGGGVERGEGQGAGRQGNQQDSQLFV